MRIIRSVSGIRKIVSSARSQNQRMALVPTMGALHEGHLRLVDLARRHADVVILSIYVNPTQFGPTEDLAKYPRTLAQDKKLANERGVDVIFHPETLYFSDDSVRLHEDQLSLGRCGASRPGHFDGVITVVSKLFNIVQPDIAVFGQKDGQQLEVIERLVRDMYFPIRILKAPIVRDKNGLAMSSRNQYLSESEYSKAVLFAKLLRDSVKQSAKPVDDFSDKIAAISGVQLDYAVISGNRLYAAVRIGNTRLIDNRKIPRNP